MRVHKAFVLCITVWCNGWLFAVVPLFCVVYAQKLGFRTLLLPVLILDWNVPMWNKSDNWSLNEWQWSFFFSRTTMLCKGAMLIYSHFFVIQKINFGYPQLLISILDRNVLMVDDYGAADLFMCTSGCMFLVHYNVVQLFFFLFSLIFVVQKVTFCVFCSSQ